MNDNLITEIIDLNKVKANLLELQKMWEQLIVSMAAKSGKDLKFDVLAQNLKTVTTAEAELTNVKKAGLEVDGKKVKITAEIIANYDKYSKEEKQIIENEIKRKHEISETNKLLKDKFTNEQNLTKVLQRETKSISDLDKQNKDLQRIQQKLNLTTKEGTDANAKINAQIEKNKQTTKEYTNVLDAQKRNIGNYAGAVDTVNLSLGEMKKELLALRNMSFANLKPEEITQIRDRMAELTDGIGDFQAQIKTASQDRIPALMDGLQGLVAVAQGVTGTLAIFGVETEKLDKAMVQLIGVSQALKTIQELQEKGTIRVMWATVKDTAAKTANAVAAKGQAMATTGATKATRALGKAMMTNPYAAIAVAAAAAVTAIVLLVKYIKTQTSEMLEQSKIIKELKGIRDNYTAGLEVERQSMNDLFEQIKKTNVGTNERKVLVDELNRNYKDYLPNLDLEKATIQELVIAQKASNVELQNKIAIQAQDKAMSEIITKMTDLKIKEMEATQKLARAEKNRDDAMKIGGENQLSYIQIYDKTKNELDAITFSLQAQEQQLKNVQEYFRGQITVITLTEEQIAAAKAAEELAKKLEAEKDAIKAAKDAYNAYLATIKKIDAEHKLMIQFLKSDADLKQAAIDRDQKWFDANLNYYKKVTPEMQKMIDKYALNTEVSAKLEKIQVDLNIAQKENNELTAQASADMNSWLKSQNEAFEASIKNVSIIEKLKKVFNDFFGTKPIEDWRDTFKESITTVFKESFELYNQIIDMQSEQLDQELNHLDTLYDKQMEGLESTYDRRKKLLEATIDDEVQLAAALARIEEEKAAVQGKFQDDKFKKEQEIAKKQAILAKKKAEMEVAAGSASSLVEAIKLIGIATTTAAPGDPYSLVARIAAALAAALTVVGAVTAGIAKVKAIQIPQFWAGGEAQEGQLISVAERGKEMAVGESGQSYMFDKQSVLVAPEKMRIFSNKETKQIMEKQTINNTYEKSNNVSLTVNIDNERHKKYFKLN